MLIYFRGYVNKISFEETNFNVFPLNIENPKQPVVIDLLHGKCTEFNLLFAKNKRRPISLSWN